MAVSTMNHEKRNRKRGAPSVLICEENLTPEFSAKYAKTKKSIIGTSCLFNNGQNQVSIEEDDTDENVLKAIRLFFPYANDTWLISKQIRDKVGLYINSISFVRSSRIYDRFNSNTKAKNFALDNNISITGVVFLCYFLQIKFDMEGDYRNDEFLDYRSSYLIDASEMWQTMIGGVRMIQVQKGRAKGKKAWVARNPIKAKPFKDMELKLLELMDYNLWNPEMNCSANKIY